MGEAHDVTAYDGLMQQRDSDPGAMLADKGYDSDAIRHDLRDSGATSEIPTKSDRKVQYSVSKPFYAARSRIECFIGHLKEQRRIATRYDKLATSFIGFVLLGCIRISARFVHRAKMRRFGHHKTSRRSGDMGKKAMRVCPLTCSHSPSVGILPFGSK
jgi:transposase